MRTRLLLAFIALIALINLLLGGGGGWVGMSDLSLEGVLGTIFAPLAFIIGVLPLAFATGAGAGARNSVGTSVAGGMVASTFLSVIFIPVLYVVIRSLAPGKARGTADDGDVAPGEGGPHA